MDPSTLPLADLAKQAAAGLLLIPLIWYTLRDVKKTVGLVEDKLRSLELARAGDNAPHDIRHLKASLKKSNEKIEELTLAKYEAERQLAAIWSKIGDRPEDKQRRGDT